MEVRDLPVLAGVGDQELEDWAGRIVRPEPGLAWHIFICHEEVGELWLCTAKTPLELNGLVVPEQERLSTSKTCALLGQEWGRFERDFLEIVAWQERCQRALEYNVATSLARASAKEILDWREQLMRKTRGELMRAALTHDDPRAVSN